MFYKYWENLSFSIHIEIRMLIIHKKNKQKKKHSFASPLKSGTWITFYNRMKKNVYFFRGIAFLHSSSTAVLKNALSCLNLEYSINSKSYTEVFLGCTLRDFLWKTIYSLEVCVASSTGKLHEVTWPDLVVPSSWEGGIPSVSSSLFLISCSCHLFCVQQLQDCPEPILQAHSIPGKKERIFF